MLKALDRLLEFCASLKLAITLILSLAAFLGIATVYERCYGTRAVQDMVYGSRAFVALLTLLSINIMAAVVVRYPWSRRQTGFIITHCGLEILLLGCLLSFRSSVDGRMSLFTRGDAAAASTTQPAVASAGENVVDQYAEQLDVACLDGGHVQDHLVPLDLWQEAGYPSLGRFILSPIWKLPDEARWPEGHRAAYDVADGVRVEIEDWLPAAKPLQTYVADPDGFPAARVRLGGKTPIGMPVNEAVWLSADNTSRSVQSVFDGAIEMSIWKARGPSEIDSFLRPPLPKDLPALGRVVIHRGDAAFPIDVTADAIGRPTPLGNTGVTARIDQYLPVAKAVTDPAAAKAGTAIPADPPTDPALKLTLTAAGQSRQYLVLARRPNVAQRLDAMTPGDAQAAPFVEYFHPAAYATDRAGTRGRLQLLEGLDGKLYLRRFGLTGLEAATEVALNTPYPAWMGLNLTVTDHLPAARFDDGFRPAQVPANKMDEANRAMKVAVVVDGQRRETWVARSAGAATLDSPRGPVRVSYEMEPYVLPFRISLRHAERKNDPGSENPAAYTSAVEVTPADGGPATPYTVTMNQPLSHEGLTFYQAGFQQIGDVTVSTFSVRRDPGTALKYAGCGLVVAGIFTMFYMKAYFQKPRAAVATAARAMPAGAMSGRSPSPAV